MGQYEEAWENARKVQRVEEFRRARPTTVYVDSVNSICVETSSSGGYATNCIEHEVHTDTQWIIYRCIWCHTEELDSLCKGRTETGRRCRRNSRYKGYCHSHKDDLHNVTYTY